MSNVSFANVTPQDFELTPCRVTWNSIDLGGTMKNVTVKLNTSKAEMKADQYGTTVLNRKISGHMFEVDTVLAEIKNHDTFKKVCLSALKVTSGGNSSIVQQTQVGAADSDVWQILKLHPLSRLNSDLAGDMTFFRTVPDENTEVVFGPTEQQGLKVSWKVYPDTSQSPAVFYVYGDPSIGLVAATAASPVAGANTGNGTCGSQSAGSRTQTETITITCLAAKAHGGIFQVVGSVTGPIGGTINWTGSAGGTYVFTSNWVNFTLTDGTTDFAAGDSFTIATVAANYA